MFDFLKRQPASGGDAETKASATARVRAWPGAQGRVAATAIGGSDAQRTRAGFLSNPVGFRAVKLIAEAAAAVPLVLQDRTTRYETHPVLDLLSRPNAGQGQAELMEALYGQLLLTGNAYVEAVAPEDGLPLELHVLRSDRVRVVPGQGGWPEAFDYTVAGRTHRFALPQGGPAPICHLKAFHPQDDHYGLSPLASAAAAIEVHNAASAWSKGLLDNAARPSGAIVYSGADGHGLLSPDQFDRLTRELADQHQGARNAGRPMLLEGGLDWKPMGFSPSDMEFQKTKEAAAREIATAFGVPPMMLGLPGDATYANYAEANRAFYRLTVLPLVAKVTAKLADWLEDFSGARLLLAPDPDGVPALAADREAAWRRIGQASFLTDAEKRSLLGLPAREVGDD